MTVMIVAEATARGMGKWGLWCWLCKTPQRRSSIMNVSLRKQMALLKASRVGDLWHQPDGARPSSQSTIALHLHSHPINGASHIPRHVNCPFAWDCFILVVSAVLYGRNILNTPFWRRVISLRYCLPFPVACFVLHSSRQWHKEARGWVWVCCKLRYFEQQFLRPQAPGCGTREMRCFPGGFVDCVFSRCPSWPLGIVGCV